MSLEITGLNAGYDGTPILHDVDCTVEEGEIVGIVGRNGVGKTTLLKAVMGLLEPEAGTVQFNGEDVTAESADVHARRGIGYVPQGRDVFAGLTVEQNLMIGEGIGTGEETLYDRVYDYFPILEERADQDAGTMSGGQQQMLAIGRALVGDPDLLLVDEPSEGVQPSIVQSITEDLKRINEEFGTTILFVEQNLSVIQGLAERCYAMDHGRMVDELDGATLADRDHLEEYLVV
ncbi:amino acid/amide ABC transporter ATP-binding protein 2 (HAAT family) [Halohasta litchfieldiae]|jgi:branched-chain amino acid transport system ATP-binding protein|uniref:Amino acid/amide ABC transporter ATP-binding protein 2, HAAT family n=1 Tax=Halohasta litchfieldiae TaxID=1073996 RepID=A0A1H6UGN3_9EURY|nr:ABC transporter ATP-binding protein [Halohasta litchfieldiae]ATW87427.1 amino acid/amide ABC transporter ATP-binding protein 2 (HAAT family) [Halohasta litchfieldiae]SEI89844.1 amino acid/amide ABC transporter ATP-binding protein 2, HAAT family [Halohasta litchfieldiae]